MDKLLTQLADLIRKNLLHTSDRLSLDEMANAVARYAVDRSAKANEISDRYTVNFANSVLYSKRPGIIIVDGLTNKTSIPFTKCDISITLESYSYSGLKTYTFFIPGTNYRYTVETKASNLNQVLTIEKMALPENAVLAMIVDSPKKIITHIIGTATIVNYKN